jgi:hypothetical protein
MSLKAAASSATSAGPPSGARASRSPRASSPDAARGDHRRQRRRRQDGEEFHVVVQVEHHPAGEKDGAERQGDRKHCEPRELETDGRQQAQQRGEPEPDGKRRERDDEGGDDHGTSR